MPAARRRTLRYDRAMSHHNKDEHNQEQPKPEIGGHEIEPAPKEEPRDYPDPVDDAADDSFPASDPPSWGGSTATVDPA